MNRETTTSHVETWQFFNSCIEIFKPLCKKSGGKGFLSKLFGVEHRQIERWSSDPDFTSSAQRNPMDKYETVLKRLVELGRKDVAIGAVDRQAQIVDSQLTRPNTIPDKQTLNDELLDDLPAISAFHTAMRNGEHLLVVRELFSSAQDEIAQSYEAYRQESERKALTNCTAPRNAELARAGATQRTERLRQEQKQ